MPCMVFYTQGNDVMSDAKQEKPKTLFTSLSLLKNSIEFIKNNVQVLALVLSVPIILDAFLTYFVVAYMGAEKVSAQLVPQTMFSFTVFFDFGYWLFSFYLSGIVYYASQRLFLLKERPHFPTFLKSPGVRKLMFYLFVINARSLLLLGLFSAPFLLFMWLDEQYPGQFWPGAGMIITVVPLMIAAYRIIGWVTRVSFALPAACLNDNIDVWTDLKRANELGEGHVKTFLVALIILLLPVLVFDAVIVFFFPEMDVIVKAFAGSFFGDLVASVLRVASSFDVLRWVTMLVMVVMYCIAFQALERDGSMAEDKKR